MHPIFVEIRKQLAKVRDGIQADRWIPEQWWEAFVYTFYYGPKNGLQPDADDLLFLVLDSELQSTTETPYTVIRRMEELPAEFHFGGTQFTKIDWRRTLELNLVMQTSYDLTVAICSYEEVPYVRGKDELPSEGSVRVQKSVHASTVTVKLDVVHSKVETPSVCYPDICFAVEDYEAAFSSLILSEESQVFCVMLSAKEGLDGMSMTDAKAPEKPVEVAEEVEAEMEVVALDEESETSEEIHDPLVNPKVEVSPSDQVDQEEPLVDESIGSINRSARGSSVFGGFVTYSQVKMGLIGRDLCVPRRMLRENTIPMKGPGGRGVAEVFTRIDIESDVPLDRQGSDSSRLSWEQKRLMFLRRPMQSAKGHITKCDFPEV